MNTSHDPSGVRNGPPKTGPAASEAANNGGNPAAASASAGRSTQTSQTPQAPQTPKNHQSSPKNSVYGALDLGTNNCRLLLARPSRRGFRVVDAFSRIIRLGEGLGQNGHLSEAAMLRTIDALKVCAGKLERHDVSRARFVATEACRVAGNGPEFIGRVRERCGLDIEILSPEHEARLAVSGCVSLIDPAVDYVLVFDIGGGSSEIICLDLTRDGARRRGPGGRLAAEEAIAAADSLGDQTLSTTILDRLMHRAQLLEFEGRSYRLKEAAARLTAPASDPA